LTFEVLRMLKRFDPDIVMLGGFLIPSNYLAYRWARRRGKKVVVFTETFRSQQGLHERGVGSRLLDRIYRGVDAVFACSEDATEQMRRLLPRLGQVTHTARYPADIDRYFRHPLRQRKSAYTYIFPNRLIDRYNPLLAIDIFADIRSRYPRSRLKLNAQGDLLRDCQDLIRQRGIGDSIEFLSDIRHWDDLSDVYRTSDILIFPAKFSNGNYTLSECAASGMGIVCSNRVLGTSAWLRDGQNGFLCDPDKGQFLSAIERYIDCPELLQRHAAVNREVLRPRSGAGTAELYVRLIYENVLQERARVGRGPTRRRAAARHALPQRTSF
jgi:glycosyltransferase involved in cell wall biosynthesis